MKIGDLAKVSGLSVHTIRYYETIGLLPRPHRDGSGHRQYGTDILGWLDFLGHLKSTGMGIADMVAYARLRDEGAHTAEARRTMLETQKDKVEAQIALLQSTLPILEKKIALYHDMEHAHLLEADNARQSSSTIQPDHRRDHQRP
jgi:DNA-binding transcriptional MerR regulator